MRLPLMFALLLISCKGLLPEKDTSGTPATNIGPSSSFVLKDAPVNQPAPPALRLPAGVAPLRYRAALDLDPAKPTFTGEIEIDISITKETTSIIWLHANNLEVKSASLWKGKRKSAISYETLQSSYATLIKPDEKVDKNFIGLDFGKALPVGEMTLFLSYKGKVRSSMSGLFMQEESKQKYLYTQFETTHARSVFPCFDEPSFKVPWQLTITAPAQLEVFANTSPVSAVYHRDSGPFSFIQSNTKTITFAETKPLPSYLVAFAVGPFEIVDGGKVGKNKVAHRVITLKGQGAWAREAIEATPAIVDALERYLGSPYPYEKLDQIAVPSFFGAMENPGLITYANSILTADPSKDNTRQKRIFASVGAHELAHQWFGNLVTLSWWDELWLNESFAEWASRKIVMELHPDWPSMESAISSANDAKQRDQEADAIAIRQPIKEHKDIGRSFGNVYSKGQAMLFMLERALGPQVFQKGIQRYLQEKSGKNATSNDLLTAISAEAGRDVSKEFYSFTDAPGVPVVAATMTCEKSAAPKLSLTQGRLYDASVKEKTPNTWRIPVCIRYRAGAEEKRDCFVMESASMTQTLTTKACPDWLVLNDAASGYYYSSYTKDLLLKLLKDGGKALSTPEKLSVLSDLDAQVSAGDMLTGDALGYMATLFQDPSYYITRDGTTFMKSYLSRVPPELKANKEKFFQAVLGPKLKGLSFTAPANETEAQKLSRRATLQSFTNTYKDQALIDEARKLFQAWLTDKSAIEPELVSTVLSIVVKNGDATVYDTIYNKGKEEKSNQDQRTLFSNLGEFTDAALVERSLALVFDKDFPKGSAEGTLFRLSNNPKNFEVIYTLVSTKYDALIEKFSTPKTKDFAQDIPWLFNSACDADKKKKVEELLTPKLTEDKDAKETLDEVLQNIDRCIAFQAKHAENIKAFLQSPAYK